MIDSSEKGFGISGRAGGCMWGKWTGGKVAHFLVCFRFTALDVLGGNFDKLLEVQCMWLVLCPLFHFLLDVLWLRGGGWGRSQGSRGREGGRLEGLGAGCRCGGPGNGEIGKGRAEGAGRGVAAAVVRFPFRCGPLETLEGVGGVGVASWKTRAI